MWHLPWHYNAELNAMINRFPTDRINNFCDAVFAIAMTLLILEIKVPSIQDMDSFGFANTLRRLIPSFTSFLISFLVTALYWRAHLMMARFAKSYNDRELWLTIWLLLFVVLLPFSTAFYSRFFGSNSSFIFYCINLVMIGFCNYFLVRTIIIKEGCSEELTPVLAKWLLVRGLIAPLVWAFSAAWVFVHPLSARFIFIMIFVIQIFVDRKYKKQIQKTA